MRMRRGPIALLMALAILLGIGSDLARAQSFYEGKTVRIIVGLAGGGGVDTYARVLARHWGKHIPGNPTIIVENMVGAGSLISANHIYRVAKPDGLIVGNFDGSLILSQVLGQPGIEFDARKFQFIGATAKEEVVCGLTKASGITSLDKWMAAPTPVKLGGILPGATPDKAGRTLKAALGLPIQVVTGYKGTSEIRLAATGGEVAGACWGWGSLQATWRKALDAGEVRLVLQAAPKPHRDLPSVPLAINFAKTDDARRLIEVAIHNDSLLVRTYTLPPGTPKDRVQILRKAFQETLRDPALLAEIGRAHV